jgi:putative DNA primase/helicase
MKTWTRANDDHNGSPLAELSTQSQVVAEGLGGVFPQAAQPPVPAAPAPPPTAADTQEQLKDEVQAAFQATPPPPAVTAGGQEAFGEPEGGQGVVTEKYQPTPEDIADKARRAAIVADLPPIAPAQPRPEGLDEQLMQPKTPEQARLWYLESKLHPVCDHFGHNEAGNADRFAVFYSDRLKYCHEAKGWYIWKARRWEPDHTGHVYTMAKRLLMKLAGAIKKLDTVMVPGEGNTKPKCLVAESALISELHGGRLVEVDPNQEELTEKLVKMAKFFSNEQCKRGLTNMVTLAQDEMAISAADFDPEIWAFNVWNGTIDLKVDRGAGEIYPHAPEMLITKLADVTFTKAGESIEVENPAMKMPPIPGSPPPPPTITEVIPPASFPAWDTFVQQSCAGNLVTEHGTYPKGPALERFIQKLAGLSMTGWTREKCMALAHGSTDTGKSTLIEGIMGVMGDYAAHAPFDAFIQKRDGGGATPDIAKLIGKRMVVCEEVDIAKKLSAGTIKGLVSGGGMMTARGLYEKPITFVPQCKLWLVCNHRPRIDATDSAMWSRIHVIPLDNHVPKHLQDKTLREQFKTPEAKARILAWLIEGIMLYQQEGLCPPACVTAAQEEYIESQDLLSDFLNDCCTVAENAVCEFRALYNAYAEWCRDNHEERPIGSKRFAQELNSRGMRAYRTRTFRGRQGVSLLPRSGRGGANV